MSAPEANPPPTNAPPVVSFTTTQPPPPNDTEFTFVADADDPDGTVQSFAWDLGDGATGEGSTLTHDYSAFGAYNVRLTVTDDDGASASAEQTAVVGPRLFFEALEGKWTGSGVDGIESFEIEADFTEPYPQVDQLTASVTYTSASASVCKLAWSAVSAEDLNYTLDEEPEPGSAGCPPGTVYLTLVRTDSLHYRYRSDNDDPILDAIGGLKRK